MCGDDESWRMGRSVPQQRVSHEKMAQATEGCLMTVYSGSCHPRQEPSHDDGSMLEETQPTTSFGFPFFIFESWGREFDPGSKSLERCPLARTVGSAEDPCWHTWQGDNVPNVDSARFRNRRASGLAATGMFIVKCGRGFTRGLCRGCLA